MGNRQNNRQDDSRALVVQEPRLPYPANDATHVGITAQQWKALTDAIYPSAKTVDGVMLALNYCKARGLDPFKRCVHVVPMWNTALGREVETVWPGIAELRTTASRTAVWAGNDDCVFGPSLKRRFEDSQQRTKRGPQGQEKYTVSDSSPEMEFPEWAQVTVYKIVAGQRVPFVGPKVRFVEIFSGTKGLRVPNGRWQLAPWQMIEKCAEAAALRRAFPEEMAGILTAEEMEGQVTHDAAEGVPTDDPRPIMDGGDARSDPKPTREGSDAAVEERGWPLHVVADLEAQKQNIDQCNDPEQLHQEKPTVINSPARREWPDAARQELSDYCDARIRKLEDGEAEIETDEAGDTPADETSSEELPLDGDSAGDAQADQEPPADEEESDESGSY